MEFALSKELEMLKKAVFEFATKKIAPHADQWDADHYFPYKEAIKPMGELGFFGTVIPEKYGGIGMGFVSTMLVTDYISAATGSVGTAFGAHTGIGTMPIFLYGTEAQKEKYLPKLTSYVPRQQSI